MQRDYIVSPPVKVKQSAIFDMDELYKALFRWFELYHYEFHEREYRESSDPGGGKHLEIRWYAEKKVDDYVKLVIEVDFLVLGLTDVEIEKNGAKTKTNKGTIEMRFSGYLLKDYEDSWSKSAFSTFIRGIYDKYIIRGRLEGYEGLIYDEAHKLIAEAKAFLALHRL